MIIGRKINLISSQHGRLIGYVNEEVQDAISLRVINPNSENVFLEPYVDVIVHKNSDIFKMIAQYKSDGIISVNFKDMIEDFANFNESTLAEYKMERSLSAEISSKKLQLSLYKDVINHANNKDHFIVDLENEDIEIILEQYIEN